MLSYVSGCNVTSCSLASCVVVVVVVVVLTFLENSAPTNRFRLQTEQSKFPAHLSVTTGVDMME